MLQFRNRSGLEGTVIAAADPDGVDTLYTVVKGTFDMATGALSEAQVPLLLKDEFHGDPASSSIRTPSDMSLTKPGTDVLLLGRARAPGGRLAYYVDVSVRIGPLAKYVRVFGDRTWQDVGTGFVPTQPEPFESMPLIWERAYGGIERTESTVSADPRNPVGCGYRADDSTRPVAGTRLPNLEDPNEPISSPKHRPTPACFAPLGGHWEPRRGFAGTYDEAWQANRAPYLPRDFDPRFFHLAPPGLVLEGRYLTGGEPVEIVGVSGDGPMQFFLPRVSPAVTYRVKGAREARPAHLDTVMLMPDARSTVLVWRAALACDKKLLQVEEVTVDLAAA